MPTLRKLTQRIGFSPSRDKLYLLGDLVNRGPDSVGVLRWAMEHADSVHALLGNHDLHLLAQDAGIRQPKHNDTLQCILDADDRRALIDWVRHQPIVIYQYGILMVHAGILPQWSVQQALGYAKELETALQSDDYTTHLEGMYGNQPDQWNDDLQGDERLRMLFNIFTRMRYCTADGKLNMDFKGEPEDAPEGLLPWFKLPQRASRHTPIAFGHWSALGTYVADNVMAIDSACVWGRSLTAIRIDGGRRDVIQVASKHKPNARD